jgi:Protein of unknown function (DUF4232)
MDLRSRVSRRVGVSAVVGGLAVLVPAMALAATSPGPARPAAAAQGGQPGFAPACTEGQTQVWAGVPGDGTAGAVFYQLEFSNTGPATCTLFGFPGVSAVKANGHRAGVPATRTGFHSLVTLVPGETGHAILQVTDAGAACAHPVKAAGLRVYPPGQTVAQPVPLAVEVCAQRPSMQIRAVHAGTGIPGFTTR